MPVVEVVHPAVRRAVQATRNGRVGVIGTVATITSGAYEDAFAAAPSLTLTLAACPRFVEFVEDGVTSGDELLEVAHEYLDPVAAAGVDTLVLGCTHYPLLTGVHLVRHGRRGDAGVAAPRRPRRTSTGRWPQTRRLRPVGVAAAAAPVPRDRRPGRVPPAGPAVPRARGRRGRPCGPGHVGRGRRREADGRRLLRVAAGAALGRVLLPGRARRLPRWSSTWAAARSARCSVPSARADIDAVLLSHLHADHCLDLTGLYVSLRYTPGTSRGPGARDSGAGARPGRHRRPDRRGVRRRPEGAQRTSSTFHEVTPGDLRARAVRGDRGAGRPPGRGATRLRLSAGGRTLVYTGDTGAVPGGGRARRRAPTCCSREASFAARVTTTRPACT